MILPLGTNNMRHARVAVPHAITTPMLEPEQLNISTLKSARTASSTTAAATTAASARDPKAAVNHSWQLCS
jgi:hypothetical protein